MSEELYGIKINGVSFKVEKISSDDDQSKYTNIAKVFETDYYNGNGSYEIAFLGTDFSKGIRIKDWTITSGKIKYNWFSRGASYSLIDNKGEIIEGLSAGCLNSIDIKGFIERIIVSAMEIISEYPSACIYNRIVEFEKLQRFSPTMPSLNYEAGDPKEALEHRLNRLSEFISKQNSYLNAYKRLESALTECEDEKSKALLGKIRQSLQQRVENTFNQ